MNEVLNAAAMSDSEEVREGELIHATAELREAVQEFSADVTEMRSMFSGPVPPPELLAGYEKVLPGMADRILTMAEKEGDHRRAMERLSMETQSTCNLRLVESHVNDVKRGQEYALIVAISALLTGGVVTVMGQPIVGGLLGTGGLIGLVSAFINGRKSANQKQDKSLPELVETDDAPD
jgi:uncharacterized membrane protein